MQRLRSHLVQHERQFVCYDGGMVRQRNSFFVFRFIFPEFVFGEFLTVDQRNFEKSPVILTVFDAGDIACLRQAHGTDTAVFAF